MEWFVNNIGTIIVAIVLAGLLALLIVTLIRRKKQGKSSCSCGCASCPHSEKCHSQTNNNEKKLK
jgi:hypothetical protein